MTENNNINISQSISNTNFDYFKPKNLIKKIENIEEIKELKIENDKVNNEEYKEKNKKDILDIKFDYKFEEKTLYKYIKDKEGKIISTIPDIEILNLKKELKEI